MTYKNAKKALILFFFLNPTVLFYGNVYEKLKWRGTSFESLFRWPNVIREVFFNDLSTGRFLVLSFKEVFGLFQKLQFMASANFFMTS